MRPELQIDVRDGSVRLPNGKDVRPDLSRSDFREGVAPAEIIRELEGAKLWITYHCLAGTVSEWVLVAGLCFYGEMLVAIELTASPFPPGSRSWSSYSLEEEAATKKFHEQLLETIFGQSGDSWFTPVFTSELERTLKQPVRWRFPWGEVASYHDSIGGGTYIRICYGDRWERAHDASRQD